MFKLNKLFLAAGSLIALSASYHVNAMPINALDSDEEGSASAVARRAPEDEGASAAVAATASVPADMEQREALADHDSLYLENNGQKLIWDNEYSGFGSSQKAFESDLFEEIEIWDAYANSQGLETVQMIAGMNLKNLRVLNIELVIPPAEDDQYKELLQNMPQLEVNLWVRGNKEAKRGFTVGNSTVKHASKGV